MKSVNEIEFFPRNPEKTDWDVYVNEKRYFKIRGGNPEYSVIYFGDGFTITSSEKSISSCASYIFKQIYEDF